MVASKDMLRDAGGPPTPATIGEDLAQWAKDHGAGVDRRLAQRLADVVTRIAPDLPAAGRRLLARYSLWTFLLDDELDDVTAGPDALAELAGRLITLVRTATAASTPTRTIEAMLAEIVIELRSVGPPALLARFDDALCTAISTGVQHTVRAQQLRQGRAGAPTAVEYLTVAGHHINYCSFAYALLILTRATPTAAAAQRIDKALVAASRAIRIANDLASADRDRAEGRLNIVLLPPADTVDIAALERQVDRYVRLHDRLLRDTADAGVLRRSLHTAVAVYRVTDLR
ncbi:terpene synthase family protein [Dactylosporangium sp. NPDC050688]|uniref:terpene synthase family protein n=1 Tax=Dactylosporangium sp. NPDC050688 TaxID=3157217 RepID=UPI00341038C5